MSLEIIGYFAAFLTSMSFLPQALLVIRTRRTDGISLAMYAMFTLGVAMWLAYGLVMSAWPIIVANAITLSLAGCILVIVIQNTLKAKPRFQAHSAQS